MNDTRHITRVNLSAPQTIQRAMREALCWQCRSCRRRGAALGQQRRTCRIYIKASFWLRQPDGPWSRRVPPGNPILPLVGRSFALSGGPAWQP